MKFATIMLSGLLVTTVGNSQESSIVVATQLGSVLAAEEPCHFSYDMAAIQRYISRNVSESDMGFGSLLQTMVQGQTYEMRRMTPATLAAFCAQTERVAKFNGFID
jgi:hypothetical protein